MTTPLCSRPNYELYISVYNHNNLSIKGSVLLMGKGAYDFSGECCQKNVLLIYM